jgi:hypothetical protein
MAWISIIPEGDPAIKYLATPRTNGTINGRNGKKRMAASEAYPLGSYGSSQSLKTFCAILTLRSGLPIPTMNP